MRDELNPEQSSPWHAFASAVQFLTRIPVPGGMNRLGADASLLRSAVVFFPLVGGLVGGVTGSIIFGASQVWSPFVAVIIALVIEAMITGAFHEDAVADCCDGFGGGWTRADILRIMSDSRIGSFGALGLMLAVLARLSFVASVPTNEVLPAMIAAGAIDAFPR